MNCHLHATETRKICRLRHDTGAKLITKPSGDHRQDGCTVTLENRWYWCRQVIMLDGNLPYSASYSDWKWTENSSVVLAPGPHVVTLCFIGNAVVREASVPLHRWRSRDCALRSAYHRRRIFTARQESSSFFTVRGHTKRQSTNAKPYIRKPAMLNKQVYTTLNCV